MDMMLQKDTWVWVVVQDPGGNETLLGQQDDMNNVSFIPTFLEKGDAQTAFDRLAKEKGKKYEVQAIQYGFLTQYASQNGFSIYVLNGDGQVLERIEKFD
jgi:hypothetical protein